MNANKRVFFFIFFCFLLYIVISYVNLVYPIKWEAFNRVNLLTDIIHENNYLNQATDIPDHLINQVDDKDSSHLNNVIIADTTRSSAVAPSKTDQKTDYQFSKSSFAFDPLIIQQKQIVGFGKDSTEVVLERFAAKLAELRAGGDVKIRIAYLGDSMIEGDLLSQTLRAWMQRTYGGSGVGFIPITSQVAQFRQTATSGFSSGWKDSNFRTSRSSYHYLSGHTFLSSGEDWVSIRDNTVKDTVNNIGKYLLYGKTLDSNAVYVSMHNRQILLDGKKLFNRQRLAHDKSRSIKVVFPDTLLPIYGISFESDKGVIVDNFSFRGIAGLEYARLSSQFLQSINAKNPYDLIIFQYGVNVMYKPEDTRFAWYKRAIVPVIKKMKTCFPETDFLIVGAGDRAFRYPDGYQSAIGIEELLKEQADLAKQTNSAFFSLYAAMGGKNSMVNWANQHPSLANKDYVHPNALGARILGKDLFDAIVNDVSKKKLQKD